MTTNKRKIEKWIDMPFPCLTTAGDVVVLPRRLWNKIARYLDKQETKITNVKH